MHRSVEEEVGEGTGVLDAEDHAKRLLARQQHQQRQLHQVRLQQEEERRQRGQGLTDGEAPGRRSLLPGQDALALRPASLLAIPKDGSSAAASPVRAVKNVRFRDPEVDPS